MKLLTLMATLRGIMYESGYSIIVMADELEVSRNTLSNWLNVKTAIPMDRLICMCDILHVDMALVTHEGGEDNVMVL